MRWPFRYCPSCGVELSAGKEINPIECPGCRDRFFRPVSLGVAVVLIEGERILLGKRRDGEWCIPCGYLEWGEEITSAAKREFREETGIEVEIMGVRGVHSNFHRSDNLSVGVWFDGKRTGGELRAGDDLVEVGFFGKKELPPLAFATDREVVRSWLG